MKPKRRKMFRWVAGIIGIVFLLLLGMPFWLPWVAPLIAKRAGLKYASYVRQGYGNFVLNSVTYRKAATAFSAERVQLIIPTIWAWHLLRGDQSSLYLQATNWSVTISASRKPGNQGTTST